MAIEELQHGRYKYLKRLGSGGMGEVYLMQDTRVNRQVAIKVLHTGGPSNPQDAKNTSSARLFEREARAIAALDHPNILPLYDFGEETFETDSMTYMVMPYCADGSLETWLHQRGQHLLSAPQVAVLIEQAAEGLQYAHEHHVIHLDVKPPNFLIRANRKEPLQPTLLLADFGISRNFTTVSSSSHTIRGTPAAMAPEQWSGEPVFASDQYALAVMTYEMLVGRPPFTGSMEQLMYRHLSVQPQPPSSFNPRLPQAIDPVLLRALSKKPEERFPTIAEFATHLSEAASQPAMFAEERLTEYSTLTISPSEAEGGLSRMLTLTDGEEINVSIPPGAQDGQVLRLPRAGASPDAPDMLLVNIVVQRSTPPAGIVVEAQDAETSPSLRMRAEQPLRSPETPRLSGQISGLSSGNQPFSRSAYAAEGVQSGPIPAQPSMPMASSEHDLPTVMSIRQVGQITGTQTPAPRRGRGFGALALISILVVLLVLAGSITFYASRLIALHAPQPTPTYTVPSPTATPSPTPVPPGMDIAGRYNGTMQNASTGQTTALSVHIVEKSGSGALSGTVTLGRTSSYPLRGIVDIQGKFSFSVKQPANHLPLVLYGLYISGNYLHGNYCTSTTGSCQADTGFFTVGPRY